METNLNPFSYFLNPFHFVLSDNCLGRLWTNESQSSHGNSSNSIGRLEFVLHCDRLVQVIQSVFDDFPALKITTPFNVVEFDAKFHMTTCYLLHGQTQILGTMMKYDES